MCHLTVWFCILVFFLFLLPIVFHSSWHLVSTFPHNDVFFFPLECRIYLYSVALRLVENAKQTTSHGAVLWYDLDSCVYRNYSSASYFLMRTRLSQVVRRASTAETAPRSAAAKMEQTVTTSLASAPAELVSLGPTVIRVEYPSGALWLCLINTFILKVL